jgi:tetrapyrrole methylase family protein/MazG family protein
MNVKDERIADEVAALRATLRILRSADGCPWDRERTMDDIISDLINEAYELLRAGQSSDWEGVEEELGDVLFLVIFIHELYGEHAAAPLSEIVSRVHRKIVERHPHVFGSASAGDSMESTAEWERIKKRQRRDRTAAGLLDEVAPELPPLRKAETVQRKAAQAGFDWPDHLGILEKMQEEIRELEAALSGGNRSTVKEEIGDILFTVVNLARRLQVEPENALERTTAKFMARFAQMERRARESGRRLDSLTLDEMERLWQESKGET